MAKLVQPFYQLLEITISISQSHLNLRLYFSPLFNHHFFLRSEIMDANHLSSSRYLKFSIYKYIKMKFRIITLLMVVFGLYACEDEDVQYVSFEENLITIDAEAQSVSVHIKANCPWFISSDTDRAYATSTYGEGNSIVEIAVYRNATYDQGNYTFTLTSENGQERATLLIVQDARIKMEYKTDGNVPAEGGNYNIYMTTNDDIRCTDMPDWVTHVSSRALDTRTFILECMANRTGSPRHASIVFTGRKDEYIVNIKQESYTPESVDIKIPTSLVEGLKTYKFPLAVSPLYADLSKLEATISEGATVKIENEAIFLDFQQYGTYSLAVYSQEKLVHKQEITVQPVEPVLNVENNSSYCLGQTIDLTDKNCSLHFNYPNMVQKQADGTYKLIREGTLQITSTNNYSNEKKRATINIERVVLKMESSRVTQGGSQNLVSLLYSATSFDMSQYKFYLVDRQTGQSLDVEEGTSHAAGLQTLYYRTSSESVPLTVEDPVQYVLNKYILNFTTTINGKNYHYKL